MPTPTYTALANITLGSSASSVTFSSIPTTYRDLVLVLSGTATTSADWFIRLNGSSSNYSGVFMYGVGSGSGVSGTTGTTEISAGALSSTVANAIVQFMDYSATDKHKTVLTRQNNPSYVIAIASRWADTSAVTSMVAQMASGSFATGTTLSLYGIAS